MSGGQSYLLPAMDMAKVDGPRSPIGCEGLYFHAMCKNRVSVSGWSPIGCESFRTNLNIPCPLSTTFCLPLILSVTHIYIYLLIILIILYYIKLYHIILYYIYYIIFCYIILYI